MLRADKEQKVAYYEDALGESTFIFFVNPERVGIRLMDEIRAKLKELSARAVLIKNTLARIVFERNGMEQVCEILVGPSLMICGREDVGAVAKYLRQIQREYRNEILQVKGIWFDGRFYPAEQFNFFATLPTADEARAKLLIVLREPARRLAYLISETRARFVRVLMKRAESFQDESQTQEN